MAEHPILFNTEMVRSILDGRKTMTRQVIGRGVVGRMMSGDQRLWPYAYDKRGKSVAVPCPYGQPGDLLWVRETWDYADASTQTRPVAAYRAGNSPANSDPCWKPSIHMPRWASRITLEVTVVRVERVKDITMTDVFREGVTETASMTPVGHFKHLWDTINAKRGYSWDNNPWVWVVEFKVI